MLPSKSTNEIAMTSVGDFTTKVSHVKMVLIDSAIATTENDAPNRNLTLSPVFWKRVAYDGWTG